MNSQDVADLREQQKLLEDKILETDEKLRGLETEVAVKHGELHEILAEKNRQIELLEHKYQDTDRKLKELNTSYTARVKLVNKEIAERKAYLLEQEDIISTTIHSWNDQLANIRADAAKTETDHTTMLKNIVRLEQQKDNLVVEVEGASKKLSELTYTYEERARDYRESLKQLSIEEKDKKRTTVEIETKLEARMQELKKREKSVHVMEIVQARVNEDLRQKKRKLELEYNMSGHPLE